MKLSTTELPGSLPFLESMRSWKWLIATTASNAIIKDIIGLIPQYQFFILYVLQIVAFSLAIVNFIECNTYSPHSQCTKKTLMILYSIYISVCIFASILLYNVIQF